MPGRDYGRDAMRKEPDDTVEKKTRTKKELARQSDGDEIGGEEFGRGAPVENPEQFEEFRDGDG